VNPTSDPVPPTNQPGPTAAPAKPSFNLTRVLLITLVLVVLAGGYYYSQLRPVEEVDFLIFLRKVVSTPTQLEEPYTDKDGDLVADPAPADKQIDPDPLIFGALERSRAAQIWAGFVAYLSKQTGKKVNFVELPASGAGIADMLREGKLHIASVSTGTVPLVVNTAGFVPCVVPADDNGNFAYQMEILVRKDSPIKDLADLKSRKLTLTSMSSLSSFKAPVVTLWQQNPPLRPGKDYEVQIGSSQEAIILDLFNKRLTIPKSSEADAAAPATPELVDHKGEYEAIAVANDLLQRIIGTNQLDEKQVRSIYKSQSYPPFCIGYVHTLKPELAAKIRAAFLEYPWDDLLKQEFARSNQRKFVTIDYKKDWEGVRQLEKALHDLVTSNK
jgi:phosphonate transport system substrate-binding protein